MHFTDNLIYHNTHMDWHLCSGSNSDLLEVLPLWKDIHWLGYGFPVGDKERRTVSTSGEWIADEPPTGGNPISPRDQYSIFGAESVVC